MIKVSLVLAIALGFILGRLGWLAMLIAWAYTQVVLRALWKLRTSYGREWFRESYASWAKYPGKEKGRSQVWYAIRSTAFNA